MNPGYTIQGSNVHVFKYIDTSPFEIVCATDLSIEFTQELIGATTPDSGKYFEKRPRMRSAKMVISGITTSTNDGNLSVFHFLDEDTFESTHDLEIVFTDDDGNTRSIRGEWLIESIPISANVSEPSEYTINLQSTGGYTVSELTDPVVSGVNITSDSYVVSGGKVQDNRWIGLVAGNIIEVCREGSEQLSIGLPFSFNGATGEITPDAGTTIEGQRVFVIWIYG